MYLDEIKKKCKFSDVLNRNFKKNKLTMNCPNCGTQIEVEEETKIIKLPDILIFTLERYQRGNNNVEIEPDIQIDMYNYSDTLDPWTKYELFAINIRFGNNPYFGHEICQVKRCEQWFEFNDLIKGKINKYHNNCSYGLFYKRISK